MVWRLLLSRVKQFIVISGQSEIILLRVFKHINTLPIVGYVLLDVDKLEGLGELRMKEEGL